jgi:hypothetical protein
VGRCSPRHHLPSGSETPLVAGASALIGARPGSPERTDASPGRTDARVRHVRGGDISSTPEGAVAGCLACRNSRAGRPHAAFVWCAGDRRSSRCDATCRRHEELVAHSISGSYSPPRALGRRRSSGTAGGNIRGAVWHRMAFRLRYAFHHGYHGREEELPGFETRRSLFQATRGREVQHGLGRAPAAAAPFRMDVAWRGSLATRARPPTESVPTKGLRTPAGPMKTEVGGTVRSGMRAAPVATSGPQP